MKDRKINILRTFDSLVLGDRTTQGAAPYVKDLLKSFPDGRVQQLILEVIQGLLVVLYDHGCRSLCAAAMQLCRFFIDNSTMAVGSHKVVIGPIEAIALSKYLLALPMSIYAQGADVGKIPFVDKVKCPEGFAEFSPTGCFGRYYRRRLDPRCARQKNLHLWWSWYQVKRNTPTVDKVFVGEAYKKHSATMSRPDPCPSGQIVGVLHGPLGEQPYSLDPVDLVKRELEACSEELQDLDIAKWAPQRKACLEMKANRGGQHRAVCEYLCKLSGEKKEHYITRGRELLRMEWFPYLRTRTMETNILVCTYVQPEAYYSIQKVEGLQPEELMEHHVARAKVYGICEPLKVRIITKGPAVLYWRCKPIQKALWSALKRFPHFRLIGRPICAGELSGEGKYLASVDYSAATDGVSQAIGLRLLGYILARSSLPTEAIDAALTAFGSHEIHYPLFEFEGWQTEDMKILPCGHMPPVQQTNGQLMGSIMSFPILCLINLATLRATEKLTGIKIKDPLINGDDMFYSADCPSFWQVQCQVAQAIGLEPSVGKCYLSQHCCSMNSVAFHRGGDGLLKRVDYLPVGLLHGKHKVSCSDTTEPTTGILRDGKIIPDPNTNDRGDEEDSTIGCCLNLINEGARSPLKITRRFLVYNTQTLRRELKGRNLFIPCYLGGLGQKAPPGFRVMVTRPQIERAKRLYKLYRNSPYVRFEPLVGPWNKGSEKLARPADLEQEHWTLRSYTVEESEQEKGIRADGLYQDFVRKVWLRRASTRQPCFALPAASGSSHQIVQNGVHEALNTYVPSAHARSVERLERRASERLTRMNSLGLHYPGSLKSHEQDNQETEEDGSSPRRGSESIHKEGGQIRNTSLSCDVVRNDPEPCLGSGEDPGLEGHAHRAVLVVQARI